MTLKVVAFHHHHGVTRGVAAIITRQIDRFGQRLSRIVKRLPVFVGSTSNSPIFVSLQCAQRAIGLKLLSLVVAIPGRRLAEAEVFA